MKKKVFVGLSGGVDPNSRAKLATGQAALKKKPRVFVGLSGGVDSAVSAALLIEEGFDVVGVFMKVWNPEFLTCTWREERRDAMRVAAHLNIPFLFFDFEKEYKKEVADYMIEEYRLGRTPNPDVLCNRIIKFGSFWKKASEMGADFIATGHYAKIEKRENEYCLLEGDDKEKDQSYFLWMLNQDDLDHTLFPVGNLEKEKVREIARKLDLPIAAKKDSQGICFIGEVSLEEFLSHYISTSPGKVLNTDGEIIGTHKGAIYYTIGERHGFEVTKKSPTDEAYYVVSKKMEANEIVVSNDKVLIESISPNKVSVSDVNFIGPDLPNDLQARIRYRQTKTPIKLDRDQLQVGQDFIVEFEDKQKGLSLGQSIVFYNNNICMGGGIMKSFD